MIVKVCDETISSMDKLANDMSESKESLDKIINDIDANLTDGKYGPNKAQILTVIEGIKANSESCNNNIEELKNNILELRDLYQAVLDQQLAGGGADTPKVR